MAFQVILTIFTSNQRGFKVKRKKPEESQVGPRNEAAKRGEVPVNKEDESTDSGQPMSSDSDQPILPGAPSKHTCFRLLHQAPTASSDTRGTVGSRTTRGV